MTAPHPDVFQPEFECLPVPRLRALQLERLRATLARQWDRVPPMRARLEEAGLHPDDLRTLEDLAAFPFTRKADLRAHWGWSPRPAMSCAACTPAAAPAARRPWWPTTRTT